MRMEIVLKESIIAEALIELKFITISLIVRETKIALC